MAGTPTQKFTTTTSGTSNEKPVAVLADTKLDAPLGRIIQLDGRKSYDPEKQNITWRWRFKQSPLGSTVQDSGFRDIRPHGSAVSFIPDKVGIYVVELIVNDGELDSTPVTTVVNIQLSRVPCGENLVPDAHFLWNYISNFWGLVEDREVITSIWSSTIQAIGAELIKLWDADNNKSLKTIQSNFQRRWVPFHPRTSLTNELDQRIIVGKNDSGVGGFTGSIGRVPGQENTQVFYLPKGAVGGITETDFSNLSGNYGAKGRMLVVNGEGYTIQRTSNEDLLISGNSDGVTTGEILTSTLATFKSDKVNEGDKVILSNGLDQGEYLVKTVDSEVQLSVQKLNETPVIFTGSVSTVYTVVRSFTVAVVDEEVIPDGQVGASWRIPNLLHIPTVNFEEKGVRAGDVVVFEVTRGDMGLSTEIRAQVVGVDRSRLGFEFSLEELEDGVETLDRELMRQVVQDLKIVPPDSPQAIINASAEAIISFIPVAINLSSRPFTTHRLVFKAKKIFHNKVVPFDDNLVSVPTLQEELKDPPVILRENMDYIVEGGGIEFVGGLFNPSDPTPDQLWAECVLLDNSGVIEDNFGRLVRLSKEDLTGKQTRAPYLSAVKGLFYAYTNGPAVANIRLGLQILLGLPFTEEQGVILELQEDFTLDSRGFPLGRILIEDTDDRGRRLGFRRIYFYPMSVGLETNLISGEPYKAGDTVEQFRPLSKGVEVQDYIKDPTWWVRALYGMEILKYFTFQTVIHGEIFDSNDVQFALDFVKAIKPAYTRIISTALLSLSDDIEVTESIGGKATLKFYENTWGLEATKRASDNNRQGVVLWNAGSKPFHTRTLNLIDDGETYKVGVSVHLKSNVGWDSSLLRARSLIGFPVVEGDLVFILSGQPGSGLTAPGIYEIGDVISDNELELLMVAPSSDPLTYDPGSLDVDLFEYGTGLFVSIVRRGNNPVLRGTDLETNQVGDSATNLATSLGAGFLTNSVYVGQHLIIEDGANLGEYIIEELPAPTPDRWVSETQVALKTLDGAPAVLTQLAGQSFRVVDSIMIDSILEAVWPDPITPGLFVGGGRSIFRNARLELEVLDPVTGDPFDVFTPGMVGTVLAVASSDDPLNDGTFVVTDYINCGVVVLGSASVTSDIGARSTVYLGDLYA